MAFRDQSTVGAYRQMVVERLFGSMLSQRLNDLAQKPDAPFMGAAANRGLFVKSAEASTLTAMSKDDSVAKTLEVLFAETERVVKFGFTPAELDREKASYQRSVDQMLTEAQKRQSSQLAEEYVRNFTQAEPFPGLGNEADITRRVMPTITLAEINGLAKEWMPEGNRVVLVSGPKKAGVTMPDEKQLAAAIASASSQPLTAYTETATAKALLSKEPVPGRIAKADRRDDVGIIEYELSNGVKVILKPTSFKEDEVVVRAFSPGGTSLVPDGDVVWAESTATLIGNSGLGAFNRTDLRKMLNEKIAGVSPYIDDLDEGISGSASAKDIETLFQLIYMTFVEPRADPDLFNIMKTQTKAMLGNMKAQPMFAFQEALGKALTQDHPRQRTPTVEMLDTMDLDKSFAFYKDRFGDASDFTFVFVGTLDPKTVMPLIEKYLASLPSKGRKETWKDNHITTPTDVVKVRVEKGLEPQGHTRIVFTGPFVYNQEQRILIRTVASILETRLREILREELGGTYSVSVPANYDKYPRPEYSLAIDFGSNPDRTDELVKRVFTEIDAFLKSGPTEKQLTDAKEAFIREHETNLTNNGYLLAQISTKYEYGEQDELPVLFNLAAQYRKLTTTSVQAAARQYLDTRRYVLVSLYPEKR
jgi:zinc protease